MKITGDYTVQAPKQVVWDALLNPEVLSRTLPGCEDLKQTGENQFAGKLKMKVGPVQGIFQGKITLSNLEPPTNYELKLEGKGAPGFVHATGKVKLESQGEATVLHYQIDAQVGGRIAGVGQRLLESSAKVITKQALAGLGQQIDAIQARAANAAASDQSDESEAGSAPTTAATEDEELPSAQTPSQTAFAGQFLAGLLEEIVPKERQPMLLLGLALIVLIAVPISLRACS